MRAGKKCAAAFVLLVTAAVCCCPASARGQINRRSDSDMLMPLDEEDWGIPEDEQSFTFADEEEESVSASFCLDPDEMDFGTIAAGYTKETRPFFEIEVANTGETELTFMEPVSGNGYFEPSVPETLTLAPDETTVFTIAPVVGLKPDVYDDEITLACTDHACDPQTVYVDLTVVVPHMDLTGIELSVPEGTLANGTPKTVRDMGLPGRLTIHTTGEDMEAAVRWDLEDCPYDPSSEAAQDFTVEGEVILPQGVYNPDGFDTVVEIPLSVKARVPYQADPSLNLITGIDSEGEYTTQTRLTFTALGDGMDNKRPIEGDTRFAPAGWKVLESQTFDKETQTASFRIAKAGGFTLSVIFNEQKYNGGEWAGTGLQDTKQVNFHIDTDAGSEALPAAEEGEDGTRAVRSGKPVFTEDETGSAAFYTGLILLAASTLFMICLIKRHDSVSTLDK